MGTRAVAVVRFGPEGKGIWVTLPAELDVTRER
jgi:hypothetical protein